ncbi:MAG: alpha/beta fold hydrolase [Acetobacteraceae bacterium]|nr:alpha/beta fold hydrolase [Acetobacteraceae bacterium]
MSQAAVELNYVVSGQGPWVTLVHSLASDRTLLDAQASLLERRFTVLRVDVRGHGGSPAPAGPYTMGALAQDVQNLFDRLGVERTAWVGVSLGGMIGLTHAIRLPGVIDRLAIADTTAGYPREAHASWRDRIAAVRERGMSAVVQGTLSRWFTADFLARESAQADHFAQMIAATPVEGFAGCCEAIIGYDVSAELGHIRCPTLVMVGAEDQATPPAMAQALAEGIEGARLHVIPGAAHQASVERGAEFNAQLGAFLEEAR